MVSPVAFKEGIARNSRKDTLTDYSLEALAGFTLLKVKGFDVGVAIKPSGEFVNLYNSDPRAAGAGKYLVLEAVRRGARFGDHYDGHLTGYYKRLGFREIRREANYDDPNGADVVYIEWAGGTP